MKRLAFLFIALATVVVANAAIVTGQVADAQGEPLIGVSEETISAEGEYQLILNPNLF